MRSGGDADLQPVFGMECCFMYSQKDSSCSQSFHSKGPITALLAVFIDGAKRSLTLNDRFKRMSLMLQASHASCSAFCKGGPVQVLQPRRRSCVGSLVIRAASKSTYEEYFTETTERLRLDNLSPQPGARRPNKRKGRGYGAGQVHYYQGAHWFLNKLTPPTDERLILDLATC